MEENKNEINEPQVVQSDIESKDGQTKCPKCGATDISLNVNTGKLRCNFCRHEFEPQKVEGFEDDIGELKGQVVGSGAQDIKADTKDFVTLKCTSCGAEVVIDTASSSSARCHWCRNVLSINQQVPNGSIPDVVLPFQVKKEEARTKIKEFVEKRKFFANPKFKEEFTTENIMGVYFPYMIVDVNSHAKFVGQGEHLVRKYTVGSGDDRETRYDADLYDVEREFDLEIDDLTVESSSDKLDKKSKDKTTNVINAIMPFDTENSVKFDANYMRGFTSEKRDTNVDQLRDIVNEQAKDVARFAANNVSKKYDRGIRWSQEQLDIKGQQWKAAYLPVWLYSYQEVKKNKKILHYVAVNARTKETMGSVPIHMPKLLFVSALLELLGLILMLFVDSDYSAVFLLLGVLFYFVMLAKYRNKSARHTYEKETKTKMENLRQVDNFVKKRTGLRNSTMEGANNKRVNGAFSIATNSLENIGNILNDMDIKIK